MSAKEIDVLSHTWNFPQVLYAFPPDLTVNGGFREDSSDIAPGSVAGPRVAQAIIV